MDPEPPGAPDTGAPVGQVSDVLGRLLPLVSTALGLVVTVTALNVDRSWRLVAVGLGVVGLGLCLSGPLVHRARRRTTGAGTALLVAAAGVLLVSPSSAGSVPPRPSARLALSQLQVTGGRTGPATLDVTLHNLGSRRAVLTGLRLRVDHFAYLPTCLSAGSIEASAPYPYTLPDRPSPRATLTIPLHEEVGADRVDRFRVALHAPARTYRYRGQTYPSGGSFLYQVTGWVTADVQASLSVGQAVFSVPLDPAGGQVWDLADPRRRARWARSFGVDLSSPEGQQVTRCLERNSRAVRQLLSLPGARSDAFAGTLSTRP